MYRYDSFLYSKGIIKISAFFHLRNEYRIERKFYEAVMCFGF